jgi:predicted permease
MGTPFNWSYSMTLVAEGADSIPDRPDGGPYYSAVTGDYFRVMGVPILRGRDFSAGDVAGAPKVAIVNQTFARLVWRGQDPLGKCLYVSEDADPKHRVCTTVVGVAEDAKRGEITESESFQYYLPIAQYPAPHVNALLIRSRTRAVDIAGAVRREVGGISTLPYASIESLQDITAPQLRSWRLGAMAFSGFGLLALVIAATGIISVLSYSVSQRTQEIGVRVALGAQSGQVVRLIVSQGMKATVLGIVIGGVGAYALGRAMAALLYQVKPSDPLVFGGVAVLLGVVAMVASWLPARRAAGVDPMVALRAE